MKKVAVFMGPKRPFEIHEHPVAQPAAGCAGLTLISSGVCGTDVHIHQGRLAMAVPLVIGHEFIGTVDAINGENPHDALGTPLKKGDRAIACVAIPCGKCPNCLRGETASCLHFNVTYGKNAEEPPYFHGGFGEYLYSPLQNLVKLPDDVDPFAAAAFPCGGPTVIRACEYGGNLEKDEMVVIQGNGSLGLFALAWAKAHGCRTIMVGSTANEKRLAVTRELGPDRFFDFRITTDDNLAAAVKKLAEEWNRGDGADVVIETSGSAKAVPLGMRLLRTRGRYLIPGQYSDRGPVSILPHDITFRALRLIGSGQYTNQDIKTYLDFLSSHASLQPLFASLLDRYRVADANEAMRAATAGESIKAVFTME